MSETLLYLTAGVFYTVSLELFVSFMMTAFQALPGKVFFFRKINYARFFILAALLSGLAGGYICYMADGHFNPFQLWTAFFPALFVPFLIMGFFNGGSEKDGGVVLHMKAGTYTLNAEVTTVAMRAAVVNYALWGNKVVRFTGAVPSSPVDIRAYCRKESKGVYICTGYELGEKAEYTKEEKRERFRDMILVAAAFFVPLPTAPMFLWYKKYGQGDNPYMGMMVMSLMIVVFGGCRRLFKNAKNRSSKIHYFISDVMYYIVIATCFLQILMKIGEIMK